MRITLFKRAVSLHTVGIILVASFAMAQLTADIPRDAWKKKVRVVMSADTLVIETDQGLDEVRLVCVRCPQIQNSQGKPDPLAKEARSFVEQNVMGKDAWIVFDNAHNEPRRDRDGRLLAYVYYEKVVEVGPDKTPTQSIFFLNAELLSRGFARMDSTYACGKRLDLTTLQREAKRQKLGIWAGPIQ
jgi:endonuclease YncB( thermonuclease family)